MKTLKEIQENYLAIDFFLSMSCNKIVTIALLYFRDEKLD